MDDSSIKRKYNKYKLRIKLWEKDFKKKNGRVPSKYDIREASQEIRDSYKMYYKLKTGLLEETLNESVFEDGFDISEMSEQSLLDISGGSTSSVPFNLSELITSNPSDPSCSFSNLQELPTTEVLSTLQNPMQEQKVIQNFDSIQELKTNEEAWVGNISKTKSGNKVSKSSGEVGKTAKELENLKSNLSQKLFKSASFTKRNPRKSLQRSSSNITLNSSQSNLSENSESLETLTDLQTILTKKAKEQQAAANITIMPQFAAVKSKEAINTQIDEEWLHRTSAQSGLLNAKNTNPISVSRTPKDVPDKKQNFGLSNIDVSKFTLDNEKKTSMDIKDESENIEPVSNIIVNENDKNLEKITCKRMPLKFSDGGSDSVVSDSDEEASISVERHFSKRRRLLEPTENVRQISEQSNLKMVVVPEHETVAVEAEHDNESEKDFSADDDEKDKDFVVVKKGRRKNTQPRKNPIKKVTKLTKSEDLSKDNETNEDFVSTKTEKRKVAQPNRKKLKKNETKTSEDNSKKISSANKETPAGQNEGDEDVDSTNRPPSPGALKYALALERGSLTVKPRIKLDDIESADVLAREYINKISITAPAAPIRTASVDYPVNEKRTEARKKLEEKIASGKLDENFLRINIQKKKFSRGKKTINFSKYKKQLWKDKKKAAALTGPDMDMGGCDGGVLKCFQCGQVGHFARDCKVRGDLLLPLTTQVAEDSSPFPTLDEAKQMATESAVAMHSRNISKLPFAPNFAIYQPNELDEDCENEDVVEKVNEKQNTCTDVINSDDDNGNDNEDEENEELLRIDSIIANLEKEEKLEEKKISPIKKYVGHKIPQDFLKKVGLDGSNALYQANSATLYDLNADGSIKDVTPEVLETLRMFGHTNFRKGQDRAIMRILSGLSTLVTLSTGSGKSLCYQLPAYLYSRQKKAITLVISPLVSLMEDQVTDIPHFLRAHCLHTNQTPQQKKKVLELISQGEIDILLISPEAVVAGEKSTGFGSILRQLPPIAFACIDEAHCVSQWSHNFRPSYLMICKVLKKNLGVSTILGLTATATLPTRLNIIEHLGIADGESGIISDLPLPDNLILSVSKDENRDTALLQLLLSKRFELCHSIIIYCTRRDTCESVAGFLRTFMQDLPSNTNAEEGKKKRKRTNWHAEAYHAGLPASRRRTVQNAFMRNDLRIVIATIAFGMGINKPDIRAVIHYNMPRNFESYVQEIGRAGRDGKISHCHLFLDSKGADKSELRRHIYSNSIDRHVIRKLLQRVFVPCSCEVLKKSNAIELNAETDQSEITSTCPGHEIGFSVEKTVTALDLPEENIKTLLCYMELDQRWRVEVLSSAYVMAKVISYGGPKYLKHAAKECPPLAMAIALGIKRGTFKETDTVFEFSVLDVASAIGWNSGVVKYQLKNLEWVQMNGQSRRSPITVNFCELGFRINSPGTFTCEEIDVALDTLYERSVNQERTQLVQLQYLFQGLSSIAYNSYKACSGEDVPTTRSDQLKGIIRNYFQNDYPKDLEVEIIGQNYTNNEISQSVQGLLNMYPENSFTGRNVARIFHGIPSPNFPAVIWGRCKYWRAFTEVDFNRIVSLANSVIVRYRS